MIERLSRHGPSTKVVLWRDGRYRAAHGRWRRRLSCNISGTNHPLEPSFERELAPRKDAALVYVGFVSNEAGTATRDDLFNVRYGEVLAAKGGPLAIPRTSTTALGLNDCPEKE